MGLPRKKIQSVSCCFAQRIDFSRTVGGTLGRHALAATAADTGTVDDIALLGLVTQTAGLVRTRRAGSTVNDVQLAKLYYALSAMFNECIAET